MWGMSFIERFPSVAWDGPRVRPTSLVEEKSRRWRPKESKNMTDRQQLIDLQGDIVQCLANAVNEPWDFFVVNFEREETNGEKVQDTIAVAFSKQTTSWKRISFIAPYNCCCLLLRLYELMNESGDAWASCTLEVDATGRYRFSFSYEAPKRLNGNFDDEALLKTYIPQPW
jgi:hypothetical protein